ncbi:diguanylate cyclase/two-component system sensory protein [Halohasta litchfieldiae]|jgi:DICT domain-containing protein|uniref:Diguanylate Cyclase and Two-component system sensory domain-containing protein n=1 Tax=Halohasta litchfieldiae TaxID=1073996 RepID=A0A1H6XJL7_9EURY|nr:DICT sensory domain-containing protein [Halohasta litchfieldiae]ATW90040.1 diguanylate cyclase/two-component system sensory protein [Halohasta litchfieldiae]SEJ24755.1 Diguanylate Cyclase and Two-component system sensory domain-containing protein [Halohasta litchfieldiae]
MSLSEIIKYVKGNEKTLVVFNPPATSTLVSDLGDYFTTQNVRVTSQRTDSGEPEGVVVLKLGEEVLSAVPVEQLQELLAGGALRETGVGIDDTDYHEILQHLKETTFTSYDKSRMIAISHEIEDRALRVDGGRLYAGFQLPTKLNNQGKRYGRLAERAIDIHTFAVPDGPAVDIAGLTHHAIAAAEIEQSWFVIFDGNGDDRYKTALLATEQSPNQFYGFWTDDPGIVDRIGDYLDSTYVKLSP